MKSCLRENSEADIAEERNERARKLYRYISDIARRINDATTNITTIYNLFATNIEVQRQKMRDQCEKLIFLDLKNYGKKSLELLWRKVYYETVTIARKLKEEASNDDDLLLTHILCGIGHFHNLITRLQSETDVSIKELDFTSFKRDGDGTEKTMPDIETQQCAITLIQSCLIYLGDLSRYQVEIFQTLDDSMAARYYLQAAYIDVSTGMPHNQLGNLYLGKNHNLDSVCCYIHCLNCSEPFEGALGNLQKIFEKNSEYAEVDKETSRTQNEHVLDTITQFLSMVEIWFLGKDDSDIPQRCNLIAHHFKISMEYQNQTLPDVNRNYPEYLQTFDDENNNPSYLNNNIIFQIVKICLFCLEKLNEIDEKKAFACKAFTLALFSQLLQKLLEQLETLGLKNPAKRYKNSLSNEPKINVSAVSTEDPVNDVVETERNNVSDTDEETPITEKNDEDATPKKITSKRRRRRRLGSASSDSDDSSEMSESESDLSLSESDIEILDDASESDETETIKEEPTTNGVTENQQLTEKQQLSNGADKSHIEKDSNPEQVKVTQLNPSEVQKFLQGNNFLQSIKLLQDWALTEKELIIACGESADSLFQCLVDLLNIITFYFSPSSKYVASECKVIGYARNLAKNLELEYKMIPLPEDVNLRGTSICRFDKDAAEWQILNRYKPSLYEENIIRILNCIDFGNNIVNFVPRIRYNRTMQIFYLKKLSVRKPSIKVNTKLNHKKTREWHNTKKHSEPNEGGLLRRLGRLYLASRVKELERYGKSAATPTMLALDAMALHKHLKKVKQLLKSRLFVLLVPAVVLQELDELKRTESTARDAIRWLETQLQSGSRFVRAQRPGQSRPLPLIKCPRKAPPHIHNFMQMLEYCHHFIADENPQGGSGDPESLQHSKSAPLLVLLTGNEVGLLEEQCKDFSVTGAAKTAGVSVEYIGAFYAKWHQTMHKGSKKR